MERRTSSAYVDLTSTSPSHSRPGQRHPPLYAHHVMNNDSPRSGQSSSSSSQPVHEPRGVKRRRLSDTTPDTDSRASSSWTVCTDGSTGGVEDIEAVDLTEVNDASALAKALAKQREDAIKAQASSEDKKGRSILTAHKCPVCMDTLTDATSTICGMQDFFTPFSS
jgi:hypothetical protein